MRYYCNFCRKTISKKEFEYSITHYDVPLCIDHQKTFNLLENEDPIKTSRSVTSSSVLQNNPGKNYEDLTTPQVKKLSNALATRGIKNNVEAFDGYKHVDISIPWARINIEVDGKHHLYNPNQLFADLERDSFSQIDKIATIRITNDIVEENIDDLAESIAQVARKRYRNNRY